MVTDLLRKQQFTSWGHTLNDSMPNGPFYFPPLTEGTLQFPGFLYCGCAPATRSSWCYSGKMLPAQEPVAPIGLPEAQSPPWSPVES